MKAAVFHGPNQPLSIEDVQIDKPREREVLVRTVASGVCHSDLHFVDGLYPFPAQALGLGYWRIQRMIVLPQALRIALPAMTNEFIALFKNTTLVLIVSIFDLLGIAQAALADPAWVGMNMEAYVFAGAIYWFACFGLSQWSRSREKRLQTAYGR